MSQLTRDLIESTVIGTDVPLADYADDIQEAINGTIDALLWATAAYARVEDDGTVVEDAESDRSFSDLNFDRDDVADVESLSREVIDFIGGNWADVLAYVESRNFDPSQGSVWAYLGHDLALTREGHGVGFWDRGLGELGDRLTSACEPYGGFNVCVGADGKVHID